MHLPSMTTPLHADLDSPTLSMLGLAALAAELAAEGVSVDALFARTGTDPRQLEDPQARISHRQRLAIYRNARRLASRPDVGLLAGARQRISDFGIYGYAMLSSKTLGEAIRVCVEHVSMAGAVLEVRYRSQGDISILYSCGFGALGEVLPFVAEFWRSSLLVLFNHVLEAPFPSTRMIFPYPAPSYWRNYERTFNCPIDFGADRMEWHFASSALDRPCPNANPITAQICQQLCQRVLDERPDVQDLARRVRTALLNASGNYPSAAAMAGRLGMSVRTLHRQLADYDDSYQSILDDVRRSLAIEFLQNTNLSIEQIAERVGFSDGTTFRKSFRKWTGQAPTRYRG